jgi:hypothetical protein
VMACCGQEALVGGYAEPVHLTVRVLNCARADARQSFPEADCVVITSCRSTGPALANWTHRGWKARGFRGESSTCAENNGHLLCAMPHPPRKSRTEIGVPLKCGYWLMRAGKVGRRKLEVWLWYNLQLASADAGDAAHLLSDRLSDVMTMGHISKDPTCISIGLSQWGGTTRSLKDLKRDDKCARLKIGPCNLVGACQIA